MRIPVQINEDSAEPLYRQVENQLRSLIIGGTLQEGTLLPSIREFAADLKCSVITIRRVYQDLENEGWLRTRQGTGTFVTRVEQAQLTQMSEENVRKILSEAIQKSSALGWNAPQIQQLFAELVEKHFKSDT